jgi:hypothetical protein
MTMNLEVQEGQDITLLTKRVLPCQEELGSMSLLFEYDFIGSKEDRGLKGRLSAGYDNIPEYLVKQCIKHIKSH